MQDKKRYEAEKYIKPEFYKEPFALDPTVTFQPKSAPTNQYPPPKPQCLNYDIRKDRQMSNKAYFQEITRKPQNTKAFPAITNFSSLSSSGFPLKHQETGRFCLKSDSKPTRSKKKEITEAMNASSIIIGKQENEIVKNTLSSYRKPLEINEKAAITSRKEIEEFGQVKTPTFNCTGEEKFKNLKDLNIKIELAQALEKNSSNANPFKAEVRYSKDMITQSRKKDNKLPKIPNSLNYERLDRFELDKIAGFTREPSSASKFSAIGSSISTDFPLLSPASVKDSFFFQSCINKNTVSKSEPARSNKESSHKNSRDHPQIRVKKTGFPTDVFTIKNK